MLSAVGGGREKGCGHGDCQDSYPQQTRDIDKMLDQCWASVVDGGPTLVQHLFNVACLLDILLCEAKKQ